MPQLALVMIVRDEARCIERCLNSARAWVDEMVVLDTGSKDDTAERAARTGARVFHFQWIDDFAAARNAALALTDADWRLVLDADEWIVRGAECLAALRDEPPSHIGQVSVINQFNAAGGLDADVRTGLREELINSLNRSPTWNASTKPPSR